MFQTVRHWWSEGSGQHTARLFLFEFVVVVAGVLVAQGLSNYVQQRSELAHMEAERARIRYELMDVRSTIHIWQAAIPCLNQRMDEVMAGKSFQPGMMRRLGMVSPDLVPPSPDVMDDIGQRYGAQEKLELAWMAENSTSIEAAYIKIRDKWGQLLLVDPIHGPVSAEDRAEARRAAADIELQLGLIGSLSRAVEALLRERRIPARNQFDPNKGPANSCAAIWKSGRIDPPLTMR